MHLPWNHTQDLSEAFQDSRVTDEGVRRALRESLESARNLEKISKSKGIKIFEPFTGLTAFDEKLRIIGPPKDYYESLLPEYREMPEPKNPYQVFLERFSAQLTKDESTSAAEDWWTETLDDGGTTEAENNSSAVTLLTVGDHDLLFTGDAGIPALTNAVSVLKAKSYDFNRLTFIQIPHHGSHRNISPALLNILVGPIVGQQLPRKTAFVSATVNSAPKHPSKQVTNAFLRRGASVHGTLGMPKCHYNNSPIAARGWTNSVPIQLQSPVET